MGMLTVRWEPPDHTLVEWLRPLALAAAERLELARHVAGLLLGLDDIVADERIWVTLAPAAVPVPAPDGRVRLDATLYFHPDHFLKDRAAVLGPVPGEAPWEMGSAAAPAGAPADAFSARKAERILYHQFLLLRDLCDGTVEPKLIPPGLAEAFQEAWSVTLDGRLRRAMLPGYSLAERRRRFFRVFSAGGVLLPQHWQIFHDLWEWDRLDQARLLGLLAQLPQPRSARRA
jgi:hypothetical protein